MTHTYHSFEFHFCRRYALAFLASFSIIFTPAASLSLPQNGIVSAGQATISNGVDRVDIHQQSNKAVIDWRGFDLKEDEEAQFHQPNANSLIVNRVNSINPSIINGKLSANGNVMVINPNGMLFGSKANVDVNGLIASTADADNTEFMRGGKINLDKAGNPNGLILNQGTIKTKDGGNVAMLAPNISNQSVIEAKLGKVALASGDTATVDLYGDDLINAALSDKVTKQIIENNGIIVAGGGQIAITAAAGETIVDSLINLDGLLNAKSVGDKRGSIKVQADGTNAVKGNSAADKGKKNGASNVWINGVLDVSGRKSGERGGIISVSGDSIALLDGTFIDASGSDGAAGTTFGNALSKVRTGAAGGDIRIGGDYLGLGDMPAARNVYVDKGVYVLNDALQTGDAGRTIFWSDNNTAFYGNVFSRALGGKAVNGGTWDASPTGHKGDGGFVETSGHKYLDANGYVNLTASNGARGSYLLDPADITIYGLVSPTFNSTDNTIDLNGASNNQLSLWLDASDATSISATSGAVDSWSDKSGFNNTASGSLTARPTTGTRTINGLNVIKFDGFNDELSALDSASLDVSGTFSMFLVNSIDTLTTPAGIISKRIANGNNDAFAFFYFTGGRLNSDIDTTNNRFAGNTVYSTGATQYQNIIFNGALAAASRVSVYDSGLLDTVGTEATASIPNYASNLFLGRLGGNASSFFNGVIGEVLLYNTALATTSRQLVDQYLSAKWNKTLTPPGTSGAGTSEALKAMASTARAGDTVDGYSVFSTRYLERLSQSANINLKASNNIILDLKTDTLNISASGTSVTLDAGNQIQASSAGKITTNNGNITLIGSSGIVLNHSMDLTTNGGNLNFNNNLQLGASQSFNSGSGTTAFSGTVNGNHNFTVNASTINFSGAIGGITPLNNVTLTSANAFTLPAITTSTITARTTGVTADLILGGNLSASATTGDSIILAAGRDMDNSGNRSLTTAGTARWQIYSGDTANAATANGTLVGYNRYGCSYSAGVPSCAAGTDIPASGNGFYFAFAPTITLSGVTANNKSFDSTTSTTLIGTPVASGAVNGDSVTIDSSAVTANFADSTVGTAKPVTVTGFAQGGTKTGYIIAQPTGLSANITAAIAPPSGGGVFPLPIPPATLPTPPDIPTVINPVLPTTPNIPAPVITPPPTAINFIPIPVSVEQVSANASASISIIWDNEWDRSTPPTYFAILGKNTNNILESKKEDDDALSLWNGLLSIDPVLAKKLGLDFDSWTK
jgi:filamentous hemagglutinin family protein